MDPVRAEAESRFQYGLAGWRRALEGALRIARPRLSEGASAAAVGDLLLRLVFLACVDARGLLPEEGLAPFLAGKETFRAAWWRLRGRLPAGLVPTFLAALPGSAPPGGDLDREGAEPSALPDDRLLSGLLGGILATGYPTLSAHALGLVHEGILEVTPEGSGPGRARRRRAGVHYTPEALVELMLDEALAPALAEVRSPEALRGFRVLDPACGGGAFLLGAYRRLLARHRALSGAEADPARRLALAADNLFGFDLDPRALALARTALLLTALEGAAPASGAGGTNDAGTATGDAPRHVPSWPPLPDLGANLRRADALLDADLPGGHACVVANPPFVDSEAMAKGGLAELRRRLAARYATARGNWDLYIPFLERALELARPGGYVAVVTPDKWLARPFGAEARRRHLPELRALARLGPGLFPAARVDAVVAVFRKSGAGTRADAAPGDGPAGADEIRVQVFASGAPARCLRHRKATLDAARGLDHLFSRHGSLLARLEAAGPNRLFACENACATSDAYRLQPLLRDLPAGESPGPDLLKVINTGTVGPYLPRWGLRPMTYLGRAFLRPVVARDALREGFGAAYPARAARPKLILKGLTLLAASLDLAGALLPGKSTLVAFAASEADLKLAAAFLNSRLLLFYLRERHPSSSYNGGLVLTPAMLDALPVPDLGTRDRRALLDLVEARLAAAGEAATRDMDERIEGFLAGIYGIDAKGREEIAAARAGRVRSTA